MSQTTFVPALPLNFVRESAHNPRKRYDQASLEQLAETIRARGVLNPVIVREVEDNVFELAAGHRRCRAAKLAGLTHVPAQVKQLTDEQFLEILHLDNLQREDIDPLDEALGYHELVARGYDAHAIAEKIGKSTSYVVKRLTLTALSPAAREAVARGFVPVSHALELAKLQPADQNMLLDDVWNLNVAVLEAYAAGEPVEIDDAGGEDEEDPSNEQQEPQVKDTQRQFRSAAWMDIGSPSLVDLKRTIAREVLRRLAVVPWPLSDSTLHPQAGACTTCPKRSSQAPMLFEELDPADDVCTDGKCFEAKQELWFERQRAERKQKPTATPTADEVPYADDDSERDAPDERHPSQADVAAAREREELAWQRANEERRAAAEQMLRRVPTKAALRTIPWLLVLLDCVLGELGAQELDAVLAIIGLNCEKPADRETYQVEWRRERIAAWAREPQRTVRHLTQALILACLGSDLVVPRYGPRKEPARLLELAHLANVDLVTTPAGEVKADEDDDEEEPQVAPAIKARKRRAAGVP